MKRNFFLVNNGFFSQPRKGRDGIHAIFDIGQHNIEVGIRFHLDTDRTQTLTGHRIDFIDALKIGDRFFNLDKDAFFDFLRRRPEIGHSNRYLVKRYVGRALLSHGKGGSDTEGQNHYHEQVGGDMIACKPCDDAFLFRV